MSNNTIGFSLALILVAGGGGALTSGCSDPISSVCGVVCFCEQCAQGQQKACETQGREASKEAYASGCGDEFEANLSCLDENLRCEDMTATRSVCFGQLSTLNSCLQNAPPPGPPGG